MELIEKMRSKGDGEKAPRPMSDLWQTMQITRRVDANEEGVGKVNSDLMQDTDVLFSYCLSAKYIILELVTIRIDGKVMFSDLPICLSVCGL